MSQCQRRRSPDVVTFTHLIRQLVVEGQKDAARTVYKGHASARGYQPTHSRDPCHVGIRRSAYGDHAWANEKTRGLSKILKMLLDKQHNRRGGSFVTSSREGR